MSHSFDARTVNESFGDPGVYVGFRLRKRAVLFDLGDNAPLAARDLLRVTHVFVSHTHMDHFIGFDRLVRICVGTHAGMALFGPPGFVTQVERRLAAYTWDRDDRSDVDLVLTATEVDAAGATTSGRFRTSNGFLREPLPPGRASDGVLVDDEGLQVRCVMLEHRTPCLGFAIEEKPRVNVRMEGLAALGLVDGPWIAGLKHAAQAGAPDDTPIRVAWSDTGGAHERVIPFGALKDAVESTRGEKIVYVTDVVFNESNLARIAALARDADVLFIESVFLDADREHAARKQHLTARQAGTIARAAGARKVIPFHFSPRYKGRGRGPARGTRGSMAGGLMGARGSCRRTR